jgi:hypothetical protein
MAKIVFIGDSLTQGFQSGAITKTLWSYPAIIARSFGLNPVTTPTGAPTDFLVPDFSGANGLPVNLEAILRSLRFAGNSLDGIDLPPAFAAAVRELGFTEKYWETGPGNKPSKTGPIHHNLAVWGYSVADSYQMTEALSRRIIQGIKQKVDFDPVAVAARDRTTRRTQNPQFLSKYAELTPLDLVEELAKDEPVENLLFWLGANNVLGVAFSLDLIWSQSADVHKLPQQRTCNIWTVEHFALLWREAEKRLNKLRDEGKVKNVLVGTIPDVTIPPVTRGVSPNALKVQYWIRQQHPDATPEELAKLFAADPEAAERSADGLYEYYTHFWIQDKDFAADPSAHPQLTLDEARQIRTIIAGYNEVIEASAKANNYVFIDLAKKFDQYAFRRQAVSAPFPQPFIDALAKNPDTAHRVKDGKAQYDTRFIGTVQNKNGQREQRGGFFALDGVHPTTTGYGVVAYHILEAMKAAGIPDADPANLKWNEIVANDTLLCSPPPLLDDIVSFLGHVDPIARRLVKALS